MVEEDDKSSAAVAVIAPHVVDLNEAINGQLGTKIKQVAINYRSIREGIMKKMQIKSREKYY